MQNNQISLSKSDRLDYIIDFSWMLFFEKITTGRIKINKESSMQLHYSSILHSMGELFCILPDETFSMELESCHDKKNLDITLAFNDVRAAIELKCFRKLSNRAQDLDMYDMWVDINRLSELNNFEVKRFICLTDHDRYPKGKHGGYSKTFSVAEGIKYHRGSVLVPQWQGKWKNPSRDKEITVPKDITFNWNNKDEWFYFLLDL